MDNTPNKKKLKVRIEEVLIPIFGESIRQFVNEYNDNEEAELLTLVDHMLTGYFGDAKAKEILKFLKDNKEGVKLG